MQSEVKSRSPTSETGKVRLGPFALTTFLVVVVLGNVPAAADMGATVVPMLGLGALLVMLPSILVASELATAFPRNGGLYVWVNEAFGERAAVLATWFQWLPRVMVVPTIISFIAATTAYGFNPALADNGVYLMGVILIVTWISVWLNTRGVSESVRITTVGALVGAIWPALLLIAFGAYYAFDGGVDFSRIDVGTFTEGVSDTDSLAMITLAFASFIGLEVTANYIESVHAAKQTYRKALLIAGACAVVVMIGTPLAVALTLPGRNIDLMTGVMRAFEVYATKYGVPWLVLPMGLIIGIATITQATAYMLAPAMGLQEVAYELRLAKPLHGLNDQGIPAQLLVIQGIIITVVSTVFAFAPNASVAFAIILNLVVMLYMGAYGLMYCAALRLRYTCPDLARPKPVPGGKIGLWLTCLTGLGSSIFLFVVGFAPPPPAMGLSATASLVTMLVGLAAATGAPFLLRGVRHPQPRGGLRVDP